MQVKSNRTQKETACRQGQPLLRSGHVPAPTCRISSGVLPAAGDASITGHSADAMSGTVTQPRIWRSKGSRARALRTAWCINASGVLTSYDVCNSCSTQVPAPTEVQTQLQTREHWQIQHVGHSRSAQCHADCDTQSLSRVKQCSQQGLDVEIVGSQ